MRYINDLLSQINKDRKVKLIVAVAEDDHVLKAVYKAKKEGLIKPLLIGDKDQILMISKSLHLMFDEDEIIDEKDKVEACRLSVSMTRNDDRSVLMKGIVDSSIILRAALKEDEGLRTDKLISHVSILEIPNYHKLLVITDGAMNTYPDVMQKQKITDNAIEFCHLLGLKQPKVGCIAAIEKVNPKMQATLDCDILKSHYEPYKDQVLFGGPYALDNAINQEAAHHKGIVDDIAGDVDVLLMPQIESGNVFYKSMVFLANAKSASVILGTTNPMVLTSRADSIETKYNSILLASILVDKIK
ncbi:MAG: bifunctional enoyl-CoA hydratase/phosphate acetyltransferase [Acholeplasmataceae bacterium]